MYNNPWAEKAAPEIISMQGTPLQDSDMFSLMKILSKEGNKDEIARLTTAIREELYRRRENLIFLQEDLNTKWKTNRDKKARSGALTIEKYMSHAFGTFAVGKSNLEVSWI